MNELDLVAVREESWQSVAKAGLHRNPTLPLLDPNLELQPVEAIANRTLCMGIVAAHAFGFPRASAENWIDQEGLRDALSYREQAFLSGAPEHLMSMQMQLHGVYALSWCMSVVDSFSVNGKMPNDLIHRFPDFKKSESSAAFRSRLNLRPITKILIQLDAAYCFHWAWRDAHLSSNRNLLTNNLFMVAERRKALEWIFRGGSWDDVDLDT